MLTFCALEKKGFTEIDSRLESVVCLLVTLTMINPMNIFYFGFSAKRTVGAAADPGLFAGRGPTPGADPEVWFGGLTMC
jgi:hypothetical protein